MTVEETKLGQLTEQSQLVLTKCPKCGKERYVQRRSAGKLCRSCSGFNKKLKPLPPNFRRRRQPNGSVVIEVQESCPQCGKKIWRPKAYSNLGRRCRSCISKEIGNKRIAGRVRTTGGYISIKLKPTDFFYPMAGRNGRVLEHRLVMAKALGRCLHPWEIVHHKNHIRDDNRIENLQLVGDNRHKQITVLEARIARLERKVEEQGKLIKLLRWENKQLRSKV